MVAAAAARTRTAAAGTFGARRARPDLLAVAGIVVLTVVVELPLLVGGTVLGMDAVTQFVPWYSWLGEQLRAGRLPLWNPHVFSGAPFAADPLSGWAYLPSMALFAALAPELATPAYLVAHLALAGIGAYLLARALGMGVGGAVVAALAYQYTGFLFLRNLCCFPYAAVEAWLPLAFLGVDGAVRAAAWRRRLCWWALAGLALSQVLAAWPGQGSLYVLVATACWVAWRTLASPRPAPPRPRAWGARLGGLALHGSGTFALAVGLAAAGLLPRLEYNAVSNLAGGYPGGARTAPVGGWSVGDWLLLVQAGDWYAGVATLALATVAPFVARRRHATPFFAALCAAALLLTVAGPNPLQEAFLLIPGAARLHPHSPERVMLVFYLGAALLAGATVSALHPPKLPARLPAVLAALAVTVDLLTANAVAVSRLMASHRGSERLVRLDLDGHDGPSPAGRFLLAAGSGAGRGRYFGYAPVVADGQARPYAYSVRWTDPLVHKLTVNNQAMLVGVEDIQGYNPSHIARYDQLVRALNDGRRQDYHFADVRPQGLDSPLLDLLNVRWILVPATVPDGGPTLTGWLSDRLPTAFVGDGVRVLARPDALPRAWLVHDARRVRSGEALTLLASGAVDPRRTALLETEPPTLGSPADPAADRATVTSHRQDRITVATASDAAALLVLSEIAYPAWRATVDGQPADLFIADHALRAVAVPAGEHTVELTSQSPALTAGLAVSAATGALVVTAIATRRRRGHRTVDPP